MTSKSLIIRYLLMIPGVFFLSFGIAFVTKAGLGTSPISSIPYSLSMICPMFTMGNYTIAINALMVLAQIVILRNKTGADMGRASGKAITAGDVVSQLVISFVMGYMVDFSLWLLSWFSPSAYWLRILSDFLGSAIMALGISIQLRANVSMAPGDALVKAVSVVTGKVYGRMKLICDATMVVISAILCLVFLHNLAGVREGTIICVITTGNVIRFLRKYVIKG